MTINAVVDRQEFYIVFFKNECIYHIHSGPYYESHEANKVCEEVNDAKYGSGYYRVAESTSVINLTIVE